MEPALCRHVTRVTCVRARDFSLSFARCECDMCESEELGCVRNLRRRIIGEQGGEANGSLAGHVAAHLYSILRL